MLCLDGLLYYVESADPRATTMIEIMMLWVVLETLGL